MFDNKSLVLMGYSGHAFVVIDVAERNGLKVIAYLDFQEAKVNPYQLSYWGNEMETQEDFSNVAVFPSIGDNRIRERLIDTIRKKKWKELILIDSSSILSSNVRIGLSSILMPRVTINSQSKIGTGCIINTGVIIEHECEIGDYSHVAPGSIVAGNVKIGSSTFIGAGTTIKNGITIGNRVTIGAGTVVIHDIPDNETWVGNPARKIK